jgi:VanZ family protein
MDPWLPPLALMALIFFFSSQESLNSGLGTLDLVGRKIIHFAQYGLLTFLWWRALRTRMSHGGAVLAAFLVTIAYAATDEYHQTFVAGRHGRRVDGAIDSAGAALVALRLRSRRRAPA